MIQKAGAQGRRLFVSVTTVKMVVLELQNTNMKQTVLVMCGGQSMEHEVSIITGMQVFRELQSSQFEPLFIYLDKQNNLFWLRDYRIKQDFYRADRVPITLVRERSQPFLRTLSWFPKRVSVAAAYLAFHGGPGECGQVQGLLETIGLPHTSSATEASAIAMNKVLTKEVLSQAGVSVLPWQSVRRQPFVIDPSSVTKQCVAKLGLPAIVKPAHLGSSIGIEIVANEVALEKALHVATRIDEEVLVEPALTDFVEYNVSVRERGGKLECSPIEEPVRQTEILTFEDKYAGGAKKSGGGMESLDRHLPADISETLAEQIKAEAKKVYRAARQRGLVRIDFMYSGEQLYCTEINPIPGSMAFYLWEAAGEQFSQQVQASLEETLRSASATKVLPEYQTDIVKKFIAAS
jgi:D-alanine-D-alanine ligase